MRGNGYHNTPIRAHIEWATGGDSAHRLEESAKEFVDAGLAAPLVEFPGIEAEVQFGAGGRRGAVVLTREIVVAAAGPTDGDAGRVAAELERSLDASVAVWRREAAQILRRLRQSVPALIDELTVGTGIYPYSPDDLTRMDRHICDRRHLEHRRGAGRKWAVLPRHTTEGGVPGETVWGRYQESLNL